MNAKILKNLFRVFATVATVSLLFVGCDQGGGGNKRGSNNNNVYTGYCSGNQGQPYYDSRTGQYVYNNNNCTGGTNQCTFNGRFWVNPQGQPVDPVQYGCNTNQFNQYGVQPYNGDECSVAYGYGSHRIMIGNILYCTYPNQFTGFQTNYYTYSNYYQTNAIRMCQWNGTCNYRCNARSGRFLIFGYYYYACY